MMPIRIISGGQTGVDRAALDVALELGIPCGGYCPEGRQAEDGVIAQKYPLEELVGGGYVERTLQNVLHSDGTLIIYNEVLEGGTLLTAEYCNGHHKPYITIDISQCTVNQAVNQMNQFIQKHQIKVLNIAGPRASKQSNIYAYSSKILKAYFISFTNDTE